MKPPLHRVKYKNLNARQKENYNFLKLSSRLADYGYMTMRLSADWQGADFIAQHIDGKTFLKVQLKSRLAFNKKYLGKDICVAFVHRDEWYLFQHDELLRRVLRSTRIGRTVSWRKRGGYSFPGLPRHLQPLLSPFKIGNPNANEAPR